MAKEDKDAEPEVENEGGETEGEEGQEGEGKRKFSGKFLVMFVALPLLVLIGGGGGAAYFFGVFDSAAVEGEEMVVVEPEKSKFYYDLPEMLVNLNSQKRNSQFLKLQVALEIADENVTETLEPQLPRILDTFQIYLRELRSEDLEGSAGVYRLKEELLRRINLAITPQRVDRILFKEIIIQ